MLYNVYKDGNNGERRRYHVDNTCTLILIFLTFECDYNLRSIILLFPFFFSFPQGLPSLNLLDGNIKHLYNIDLYNFC